MTDKYHSRKRSVHTGPARALYLKKWQRSQKLSETQSQMAVLLHRTDYTEGYCGVSLALLASLGTWTLGLAPS